MTFFQLAFIFLLSFPVFASPPGSETGYILVDLNSGKTLESLSASKPFIPASVSKIPTALVALEVLGPKFQFETELGFSGKIDNGILRGNLYLRGTGDPFLTHAQLFSLAQSVERLGIKKVIGKFLYDDSFLSHARSIDPKGEKDQTYNPGVSALSSEFNRSVLRRYGRNRSTAKSKFFMTPGHEAIEVKKTKNKFQPGVRFEGRLSPSMETWRISERLRYPRKTSLPIQDPSLNTASSLRYLLSLNKVSVPVPKKGSFAAESVISVHRSKPLLELAEATLEYSNNLMAELLSMRIAREESGKALGLSESAIHIEGFFKKTLPHEDWRAFKIRRGSGMTTENRTTPKQMASILKFAFQRIYQGRLFWSLLPISGWKGWLENRLHEPENAFKVWAKTGALDYVSGMAGYLISSQKKKLGFAIFTVDFKKRNALDSGSSKKAFRLRKTALKWREKTHAFQDQLIAEWIKKH